MVSRMFTSKSFTMSALLFSLIIGGCDTSASDSEQGFRSGSLDVDVHLTVADGGEEDGTILWEIVEAESSPGETIWEVREYEPGTHPVDGGEEDGTILWEIVEAEGTTPTWEIKDPTGGVVCLVNSSGELHDASGTMLLKVLNGSVYTGGIRSKLLYTFDAVGVNYGSQLVLGTNPAQNGASAGRKLTIGALLRGNCR
jgi:hypothetical protein